MQESTPLLAKDEYNIKEDNVQPHGLLWVTKLGMVGLAVFMVWAVLSRRATTIAMTESMLLESHSLHASSGKYGKYIRFDSGGVQLTDSFPWTGSSTMVVHSVLDTSCVKLSTTKGQWVSFDSAGRFSFAATPEQAMAFEFNYVGEAASRVKLCDGNRYWTVVENGKGKSAGSELTLSLESFRGRRLNEVLELTATTDDPTIFQLERVNQIRGVNLGGWFIPEIWMNPSFSNYTGLGWAGSLCNVAQWNKTLAEEAMDKHLATWITEDDFREIAADGFNSVRLPVGYWNVIPDPSGLFVPEDVRDSLKYVDFAFQMADKYDLTVLVDLHGTPGSQNGVDHSGCSLGANWLEDPHNVDLTLKTIEAIAARYGHHKRLVGIELANEPAEKYCLTQMDAIVDFYARAYKIVRHHSRTALVVFNELYEGCYDAWQERLLEPEYYNVVIDLHLYNWQEPYTSQSAAQHVRNAAAWGGLVTNTSASHPVLVGEWCFSTGTVVQAGQPFVDACVESFHRAVGWYLWTWKVEPHIGFDEWDVQLQYRKKHGLRTLGEKR